MSNAKKEDVRQINACRTGPLPTFVEDADEDEPDFEPDVGADDFPDEQLEDGDRIWATGLLPEPEYI